MMGMVIEEGEAADQGKGSHRKREVHEGDKESLLDTVSQRRETQGWWGTGFGQLQMIHNIW